ncbi:hypothetical protein D3C72_1403670 [compost metagenome]
MILLGVLPIINFASYPLVINSPVVVFIATTEGSLRTTPLPLIATNVFDVPKSIPIPIGFKLNNFIKTPTFSMQNIINPLAFV